LQISPGSNRTALIAWILAAAAGSVGVWYLSAYLEGLATLAQSDRAAALAQFKSRALPALVVVVAIAVAAGATLMRQGLQVANSQNAEDVPEIARGRANTSARTIGMLLATVGFVLAAVPLVLLSIVLWFLRGA
jgi:hypothetical protein